MTAYYVTPYDSPDRFLVLKNIGEGEIGYLVQLNPSGIDECSCTWGEMNPARKGPSKPCKHIRQVLACLRIKKIIAEEKGKE